MVDEKRYKSLSEEKSRQITRLEKEIKGLKREIKEQKESIDEYESTIKKLNDIISQIKDSRIKLEGKNEGLIEALRILNTKRY